MTPPVGLHSGMDPFGLDADTAERLVAGMDAGDAPPEYRAVARTLHALRAAPESPERAGEPAAVERIAAAVVVHPCPRPTKHAPRTRRGPARAAWFAATALVIGAVSVTGGFASAGSLPEPAQNAASSVLGKIGISVPTGGEPAGVEEPPSTSANLPRPPTTNPPGQPSAGEPASPGGVPGSDATPAVPANPAPPGNGPPDVRGSQSRANPNKANGQGNGHSSYRSPPATPGQNKEP